MPRRARLQLAENPFHVIQRDNNRSDSFFADDDYSFYLDHMNLLARKHQFAIHAYVLMTNHVHLLLTPRRKEGISVLMKMLGQLCGLPNTVTVHATFVPRTPLNCAACVNCR